MKTTRYKFEKYLESAAMSESKEWLEKEFINILESLYIYNIAFNSKD